MPQPSRRANRVNRAAVCEKRNFALTDEPLTKEERDEVSVHKRNLAMINGGGGFEMP